jgi:hypothetical protein
MNIGGRFDFDPPHMFVGEATSLMNMRGLYLSMMWPHRRIYGGQG